MSTTRIATQAQSSALPLAGAKCIHYWLIDENNFGTCRNCHTIRQFPRFGELPTERSKHRELRYYSGVALPHTQRLASYLQEERELGWQ